MQSKETSRELIRDFLMQPAGQYLCELIQTEIDEMEESRVARLSEMRDRTHFDAESVDDVVNLAQQIIGMEQIFDKIKKDVRLEDEQDPSEDL